MIFIPKVPFILPIAVPADFDTCFVVSDGALLCCLLANDSIQQGEKDKWVSTSSTRFKSVADSSASTSTSQSLTVEIAGMAQEVPTPGN